MSNGLNGKNVAILIENGFEQVEMTASREALDEAGAETSIVSPQERKVKGWEVKKWGRSFKVDVRLSESNAEDYDALLLPGGVMNPDKLRANQQAVAFVKSFVDAGKPIAAICHGSWTLIETGMVKDSRMTSYTSIKTDIKNAGAEWIDEEVVVDNGLVTSRSPSDIPAFNNKMIKEFGEGVRQHETNPEHAMAGSRRH